MTGNFGHFFVYAPSFCSPEGRDYGVQRFGFEVQRQCDVLDKHLATRSYMVGDEYSLADMVLFPWVNWLRVGYKHKSGKAAREFLSIDKYKHLNAWVDRILERPAVQRGLTVCSNGVGKPWLSEHK